MAAESAFAGARNYAAAETRAFRGVRMAGLFASADDEYAAARQGAALFDRSPEGLPTDRVTDIRYLDRDHKNLDRDGEPITRVFSAKDRADMQRIAWEGLKQFEKIGVSLDR